MGSQGHLASEQSRSGRHLHTAVPPGQREARPCCKLPRKLLTSGSILFAGILLMGVGGVGVLTVRKEAAGMKTLYLSGAVVASLLAWSFVHQVRHFISDHILLRLR